MSDERKKKAGLPNDRVMGLFYFRKSRARRPIKLICVETYSTLSDALKREAQIKKIPISKN